MTRDEFVQILRSSPEEALKFLEVEWDSLPDWISIVPEGHRSPFVAHGVEIHIESSYSDLIFDPGENMSQDPSFTVPVETPYTIHVAEHRSTGYTRILHGSRGIYTVSHGPHVPLYHALEREFHLLPSLDSQRYQVTLRCRKSGSAVQVYYMWSPAHEGAEPEWCLLAHGEYTPKIACGWKLRSNEYVKELEIGESSDFSVLLERARFHVLACAVAKLGLEVTPRCEILPVAADSVGPTYGFALSSEMLDPNEVVRRVKPVLQKRYDETIIQMFLQDVGVDMDAVARIESGGLVESALKPAEGEGVLRKSCSNCGNFLELRPRMDMGGETVKAFCPRCWSETDVPITKEIRDAFSGHA